MRYVRCKRLFHVPMTYSTSERPAPSLNLLNSIRAFARAYRPKSLRNDDVSADDSEFSRHVVVLNH